MLNQTFPVIYKGTQYYVDPSFLSRSSRKFNELIIPYLQNGIDINSLHLSIKCETFTERNIQNFLKLCQNQQSDVMNSEIPEICEIARIFQADQIFRTGVTFIQNNFDPTFSIDYDKLDENHLIIESKEPLCSIEETEVIHHHAIDFSELEFTESCQFNDIHNNNYSEREKSNNKTTSVNKKTKLHSAWYTIQVEKPLMKCKRFLLIKDGKVILSAKQKDNEIVIAEGNEVHLRYEGKCSCRITQNREYNIVSLRDQEIKINYVSKGPDKQYSMKFSFDHKGTKLSWSPKRPKNETSFNGEYCHIPIPSKKNIILQNPSRHPTFIVRKMKKQIFEAECHPAVNPNIVFAISLSQIIGPYNS